MAAPEFHVSSINHLTPAPRRPPSEVPSQGRAFKAVVVLFQSGGCDSFNVLVPHSNCPGKDYYAEYAAVRADGALPFAKLLPVAVNTTTHPQPCRTFAVHPKLPVYKELFDAGQGAFLANIGALIEPVTKADYEAKAKRLPPSLFAHNIMQRSMHTVHPQDSGAKGVLGRAVTALTTHAPPYRSDLFSIHRQQRMLDGTRTPVIVDRAAGIKPLHQHDDLIDDLNKLAGFESGSMLADTYSALLQASLNKTKLLGDKLAATRTSVAFADDQVSQQLEQVAKLIKMRDALQNERAAFVVERGGFDSHNTWDIDGPLADINAGLDSFAREMEAQGVWDDVVFLTVSDFGRTLTSNGQGSDHAWGGNHFVAGGQVRGGQIFGAFPDTLQATGALNIGRGRLIPTIAWEAVWEGVLEWFGVPPAAMATVLPNLANFPPDLTYNATELFRGQSNAARATVNWDVAWTIPANPQTLTVAPGDTVTFTWDSFHDLQRTQTAGCDFTGAVELAGTSSAGAHVWTAPALGTYFFACSLGGHCSNGMYLQVEVAARQ